jgi:hypothetical protein
MSGAIFTAVDSAIGAYTNAAIAQYDLAYEISPIILYAGIAASVQGGALPIVRLMDGFGSASSDDDVLARFIPVPGGTIINNAIATYPFANQQVAANAIIQQPNVISLLMIAPVKEIGGYASKLSMFTSLQSSLQQHNLLGGYYYVATPARIFGPCLMTSMTDVTAGETKQKQIMWQIDFIEPLLTQAQAQAAQSTLMQRITNGAAINGTPAWSGPAAATGASAQGATASTVGSSGMPGAVNAYFPQAGS